MEMTCESEEETDVCADSFVDETPRRWHYLTSLIDRSQQYQHAVECWRNAFPDEK